jgi:hypothetical protein
VFAIMVIRPKIGLHIRGNPFFIFILSLHLYSATCGYDKDVVPGGGIVKAAEEIMSVAVYSTFS